jgi:hypothetical protein
MEIPFYPDFREIRLEDKNLFQDFLNHSPPQTSELTFTNLFMWRHYYSLQWSLWDECVCIVSHPDGKQPFAFPPLCKKAFGERIIELLSYLKKRGGRGVMQRVPDDLVNQYLNYDDQLAIALDRDNCDYVYLTNDLIKLEGNKYHGQKNHINKFKKNYLYQYKPLTTVLVSECLQMETEWCNLRHCEIFPGLVGEERAIFEALTNMESLGFKGGAILIDGKVEAFALGEPLNPRTTVIHIEKANPAFEGLYQLINQEFCVHEWGNTLYINREQDLGEEGLRKAKLSYHPHHFVNKYTIELKG